MIHASKFSSKRAPTKQPSKFHLPQRSKLGRLIWAVAAVAVLILVGKFSWDLVTGIPGLPHEVSYASSTGSQTNILLVELANDEVTALIVSSVSGKRVEIINLNPDWSINVPQGHGQYRIGAIKKLGDLGNQSGVNLLQDSISRLLAIPIDGYVAVTPDGWQALRAHFGQDQLTLAQNLTAQGWLAVLTTNTPPGFYSSFNRIQLLQIGSIVNRTTPIEVPSTGRYFSPSFDRDGFDNDVGTRLVEQGIATTRPRVSIINASGVPGAATELARYVHNLGGEVDLVDSAATMQLKTTVATHTDNQLSTRIAPLLRTKPTRQATLGRADLEITLGQDIALWF